LVSTTLKPTSPRSCNHKLTKRLSPRLLASTIRSPILSQTLPIRLSATNWASR
jgi:hypothetical protein